MAKKQESSPRKGKSASTSNAKKSPKAANSKPANGNGAEPEDHKKAKPAAPPAKQGLTNESIGATAGEVWKALAENGGQTLASLKKSTGATEDVILASIGWLAREDKLAFESNGRTVTVSLREGA